MKRICVYSGSNVGNLPAFSKIAEDLGIELATRNIELVYGGSSVGLMSIVANACLSAGGKVIGVTPRNLFRREIAHQGLTELREVETMHERKSTMAQLSDGFIALPGGVGTYEELFEAICWAQIGIHQKPVGILNVEGFYDPLIQMVENAIRFGFMPPQNIKLMMVETEVKPLIQRFLEGKKDEV